MARVNIYRLDELAERTRQEEHNVSAITPQALTRELGVQEFKS